VTLVEFEGDPQNDKWSFYRPKKQNNFKKEDPVSHNTFGLSKALTLSHFQFSPPMIIPLPIFQNKHIPSNY